MMLITQADNIRTDGGYYPQAWINRTLQHSLDGCLVPHGAIENADEKPLAGLLQRPVKGILVRRSCYYITILAIRLPRLPPFGDVTANLVVCRSVVATRLLCECGAQVAGIDGNHDACEYTSKVCGRPNVSCVEGLGLCSCLGPILIAVLKKV